ncbi:MAG: 4Fe-4S binding protein [Desulfotalea sp.]
MEKKVPAPKKGAQAKTVTASNEATKDDAPKKERKMFEITIFHEWCKSCGICSALCPKKVIGADKTGEPFIENADACIGCRFCEIHCPDFAITVQDRSKVRRKKNGRR